MSADNNVPAIRFKGSIEEWDEKTLDQVTSVYDGTHQTPKYRDSGIMFLSVENIKTLKSAKYISESDFERDFKVFPQKNDVLMTRIGDVGTANVVESDTPKAYYVTLALLKHKELDPYFLKNSIVSKKVRKDIWNRTLHIAFPKKINMNEICKVKLFKPVGSEQKKIGSYFQQIDTLIAQHEQKRNKLLNLKKALLEKMFPSESANEPDIRFKGFSGQWDKKVLGEDVSDIIGGGTPSTQISAYWDGDIYWYSPTEIGRKVYAEKSMKKITQLGLNKSSARILPADKTVLFTSRAGIGDMAILSNEACTNQGFQSFVLKKDYEAYFIYSMGFQIKDYALKHASGSTFLEISGKQLGKMIIKIPLNEEQSKIGKLFKTLDTLITQHQAQLKKLRNIKQACLDKMFV